MRYYKHVIKFCYTKSVLILFSRDVFALLVLLFNYENNKIGSSFIYICVVVVGYVMSAVLVQFVLLFLSNFLILVLINYFSI